MVRALAAVLLLAGCAGPLKRAISDDDLPAVERALAAGADVNKAFVAPHLEPAVYACRDGRFEVLKLLVAKGARVSGRFKVFSPLSLCAMYGRLDMVKFLLDKGADIGASELHWSKRHPHIHDHLVQVQTGKVAARAPGNLDDAAYDRMRAAAGMPPEKRTAASDVDSPVRRGAERPEDFALVIGIEEYQSLPKADYGARDAATVRRHFEAMGVPARNIISLEGSQATGSKLRNYLQQWLPRNVKPGSTVFVYYSGHGAPDPETGDAYLVPWDADPMFLTTSAYPLKQFYAELSKLKAKRVVVALDACFSGSGGRSVLAKGARPLVAKVDESVPAAANLTVLAAASGAEITGSLDEQGHGIFTYYFLKGLSGGAKTPRALYDYLKPKVQDDARRQNREQSPTMAGSGADAAF